MVSSPQRAHPEPRGGRMSEALRQGFCLPLSSPIFPFLDATPGAHGVKRTSEPGMPRSGFAKPLNYIVIPVSEARIAKLARLSLSLSLRTEPRGHLHQAETA